MTPWEWLREWEYGDLTLEQSTLEYVNRRIQEKYPGKYRVIRRSTPAQGWKPYYVIVFDSPAEETMFRLRWSS